MDPPGGTDLPQIDCSKNKTKNQQKYIKKQVKKQTNLYDCIRNCFLIPYLVSFHLACHHFLLSAQHLRFYSITFLPVCKQQLYFFLEELYKSEKSRFFASYSEKADRILGKWKKRPKNPGLFALFSPDITRVCAENGCLLFTEGKEENDRDFFANSGAWALSDSLLIYEQSRGLRTIF